LKVKRFLSEVASAGQAVLKEAQAIHNHEEKKRRSPKPPTAIAPPNIEKTAECNVGDSPKLVEESYAQPERPSKLVAKKSQKPQRTNKAPITPTAIVEMPKEVINQPRVNNHENDWELLSTEERASKISNGSFVACPRAGSVRSITSVDHDHDSSSHTTLSVPFKIQRTNSSSTLDSQDNAIGPSGKGVLGVDYVEHVVLPTDTLQGICIAYKVSATHLRRANHFSGTLHSAPKKLLIPLSKQALRTGFIRVQDTDTKEYKLHYFQAEFPDINAAEAKAYLELADWDLHEALQSAKEDREWETDNEVGDIDDEAQVKKSLKSGQIGIKVGFRGGIPIFNLTGTGCSTKKSSNSNEEDRDGSTDDKQAKKEKIVVHKQPPRLATKTVLAEDLYNAAPQHESYGFELQPLPKREATLTS